ncbi:hypothetical protein [Bordetella sp. LUAb4]|uniref:hypothetical protein n=1 Tax=Bordetella sp. LUAb4 TaxID=2843195 RepID=UPI001E49D5AC|nr:hypothetical protein [Bordetella sp. LUAb4]
MTVSLPAPMSQRLQEIAGADYVRVDDVGYASLKERGGVKPQKTPASNDPFALDYLKDMARHNDGLSVECLFTLAYQGGETGTQAMDFLFDLYTGKERQDNDSPAIKEALSRDSLTFFKLITERNERLRASGQDADGVADAGALQDPAFPPKLLIMAAYATEDRSADRNAIQQIVNASQDPNLGLLKAQCDDYDAIPSLLAGDRMVTANELDVCVANLNRPSTALSFHAPRAATRAAVLADLSPDSVGIHAQPIQLRQHWVLFGVDMRQAETPRAFLFDSLNYLRPQEVAALLDVAKHRLGVEHLDFDAQTTNLQQNARNGCGAFVAEAMSAVADIAPEQDAIDVLRAYGTSFGSQSADEQRDVINRRRARLYGEMLDNEIFRELPSPQPA